jgi:hypothetical protein
MIDTSPLAPGRIVVTSLRSSAETDQNDKSKPENAMMRKRTFCIVLSKIEPDDKVDDRIRKTRDDETSECIDEHFSSFFLLLIIP